MATLADMKPIKKVTNSKANRLIFKVLPINLRQAIEEGAAAAAQKRKSRHDLIVAVDTKDAVIGFGRIYHRLDGQSTIHEIGLEEAHQGKGLGRALMERMIRLAKARRQDFVLVKTLEEGKSRGFYRKLGFRCIGQEMAKVRMLKLYRREVA
jgi:ribosomal protein S18 acetylase RimI-like enzyme